MNLETLMRMQEQLTGMGAGLPDTDLIMVILGSLPKLYQLLINAILRSATHARPALFPKKSSKVYWTNSNNLALRNDN